MDIRKILIKESIFIFLLAALGVLADYGLIRFLNFIDRSSWTYHMGVNSVLWNVGIFIVCGYTLRLAGRLLRIILGIIFAVLVIAFLIFLKTIV